MKAIDSQDRYLHHLADGITAFWIKHGPDTRYGGFYGGYYTFAWGATYSAGTLQIDEVVHVETLIYDLRTDKLIWAGMSDTMNPSTAQKVIRDLSPDVPMMNICMGHQLTALALGGKHFKLKFGHRGGNQPVKDLGRDNVYITTQNHGFAIDPESLEDTGLSVTMTNLNDGSVEGMVHQDYEIMTTQFHPEATPGPLDANFLFDEFIND